MANASIFRLPVTVIRGGTSKGAYILESDLPSDRELWDPLLLRLMGSPDRKQIDGLGGGQSVTSKVAVVRPSSRSDVDVEYTFAQVSVDKPLVSYKGNCGNILSGVGPFAVEKELVQCQDGVTSVRILNTNTGKIIVAEIQTPGRAVQYDGAYAIAGVPGTAAPIKLKFLDPAGTLGCGLLPTGNVVDVLDVPGLGPIEASIVDAANPLVFIHAKSVGLRGDETPSQVDSSVEILERLELVRGLAAVKLGLIDDPGRARFDTPGIPKMTFVAPADHYVTSDGSRVRRDQIDLLSRMMSMQKAHPSYAMTGAMCTAAAAAIPGSVVHQALSEQANLSCLHIGHPSGILECGVDVESGGNTPEIRSAFGFRTANLLLEGVAHLRL